MTLRQMMITMILGITAARAAEQASSNAPTAAPAAPQPSLVPVMVVTSGVSHVLFQSAALSVPPEMMAKLNGSDTNAIMDALNMVDRYDTNDKKVKRALNRLLAHKEAGVRLATLEAIGFITDNAEWKAYVAALTACMNDANESVREAASDILGEIESKKAIDALIINLTNRHEQVREACEWNLELLTRESFESAVEWQTWWSSNRAAFSFE